MAKPHWLSGVAKILRAETDDLRELARIGGADPRTAYIGTRLDGVDLRGQDLRGMLFTDLDLSRVQHDADTRIDPDQIDQPPDTRPVLLLAARRWSPIAVAEQLRISHLRILDESQIAEFKLAHAAGANCLILGHEQESDGIAFVLLQLEGGENRAPLIIQGREAGPAVSRWMNSLQHSPIVFCNDSAMPRTPIARGLAADTLSLVRVILDNPDRLFTTLPKLSAYWRATGRGPMPLLDSVAQLFDKIWRSGLQNHRVGLSAFFDHAREEIMAIQSLLDPYSMNHISTSRGTMHCFLDMALMRSEPFEYAKSIISTWKRLDRFDTAGLDPFEGGRRSALTVRESFSNPYKLISLKYIRSLGRFRFSDVSEITISPYADLQTVVKGLLYDGGLWVNAQDIISTGGDDFITVWGLVAGQMRRFARSQSGPYRQAYLELILRAGARLADMKPLLHLLDSDVLIRLESFEADVGACRFKATVSPELGSGRMLPSLAVDVEIDRSGPRLKLL
jgi:hypothetical protein